MEGGRSEESVIGGKKGKQFTNVRGTSRQEGGVKNLAGVRRE